MLVEPSSTPCIGPDCRLWGPLCKAFHFFTEIFHAPNISSIPTFAKPESFLQLPEHPLSWNGGRERLLHNLCSGNLTSCILGVMPGLQRAHSLIPSEVGWQLVSQRCQVLISGTHKGHLIWQVFADVIKDHEMERSHGGIIWVVLHTNTHFCIRGRERVCTQRRKRQCDPEAEWPGVVLPPAKEWRTALPAFRLPAFRL